MKGKVVPVLKTTKKRRRVDKWGKVTLTIKLDARRKRMASFTLRALYPLK